MDDDAYRMTGLPAPVSVPMRARLAGEDVVRLTLLPNSFLRDDFVAVVSRTVPTMDTLLPAAVVWAEGSSLEAFDTPTARLLREELASALMTKPDELISLEDAVARATVRYLIASWIGSDSWERPQEVSRVLNVLGDSHAEAAFAAYAADPGSDDAEATLAESLTVLVRGDAWLRHSLVVSLPFFDRPDAPDPGAELPSRANLESADREPFRERAAAEATRSGGGEPPPMADARARAPRPEPSEPPKRQAYPVLRPAGVDADENPAVEAGQVLALEVGIGPARDRQQAISGGLGDVEPNVPITIHLAYDPDSFEINDVRLPIVVTPTADDPYPTVTIDVVVRGIDDVDVENRRIAAHYFVDGELRGIAVRAFREAGTPAPSSQSTPAIIDLSPLIGDDAPDVVLVIYRADVTTEGSYFVAAFPRNRAVPLPPIGRISIRSDTASFIDGLHRRAEAESDPMVRFLELAGSGGEIGDAIPAPIRRTLRRIAESAPRRSPATMLLLTDDTLVPWELASFAGEDAINSKSGGGAPFLGAHFAIGRWPLHSSAGSTPPPKGDPVDVRKMALVTADYSLNVGGWQPLDGAIAEIAALKKRYAPAVVWPPLWRDVLRNLASEVDVVHFALHGIYESPDDTRDGLVFIDEKPDGSRELVFLGARKIRGRMGQRPPLFPRRPLVFLNACQVGVARDNLGNYSGLAATLIAAGARAVVACTWRVDDDVAGSLASRFYRASDRGVAAAEILRRERARYVVTDDTPPERAPSPTLIAYQYYGHPALRLVRSH